MTDRRIEIRATSQPPELRWGPQREKETHTMGTEDPWAVPSDPSLAETLRESEWVLAPRGQRSAIDPWAQQVDADFKQMLRERVELEVEYGRQHPEDNR